MQRAHVGLVQAGGGLHAAAQRRRRLGAHAWVSGVGVAAGSSSLLGKHAAPNAVS
jgi:hypothetical protein